MASKDRYKVLCGQCPDAQCSTSLFFPAQDLSIECTTCGQRHARQAMKNVAEVTNPRVALHNMLKNILIGNVKPKKGADSVKVLGLSNYQCKLVSPLLTKYGMDKHTGKAVLLKDMGQGEYFDCGILGDRAFLIEPKHIETVGYGRDRPGSKYLEFTLEAIRKANGNQDTLLPVHADGDGHCLVHAVSRALVGRELFWHALRENLKSHFSNNLENYKRLFEDFIGAEEWPVIIEECDPNFTPTDGEPIGLRNIHIFGLANLLKRPIILLDSILGLQSSGDYSGVFLPGMVDAALCCGKDGRLNKPLCLAWSNSGRNHYITLVGIKGRPLPKLPPWLIPKVWGMPQELAAKYLEYDTEGCCVIGGDKCLQDKYILRLVKAMEDVFYEENGVSPALVADVHQYLYKNTGMVGTKMEEVIEQARAAVRENRLYRCGTCDGILEFHVAPEWLRPGGMLHNLATKTHGTLSPDKNYNFTLQGLVCRYDKEKDELVPDMERSRLTSCTWCQGSTMRLLNGDGTVRYKNGDKTATPAEHSRCECGYKHWWDGREYDNLPEMIPIALEWGGKSVSEHVYWFQYESDPALNSNVFKVAQELVQKHFPGEFGSERLVQKVVDTILRNTASKERAEASGTAGGAGAKAGGSPSSPGRAQASGSSPRKPGDEDETGWKDDTASKIILTGHKAKTLHKEELTMSEAEKSVRKKVEQKAQQIQKRKTSELQPATSRATSKGGPAKTTTKVQKKDPDVTMSPASPPPTDVTMATPSTTIATSTTPAAMVTSTTTTTKPSGKKIRVTTSEGKSLMVSLEEETTFAGLQALLVRVTGVPAARQRIRYGFPPRELLPPPEGHEPDPVPLQHGDKLTVEVMPDPNQAAVDSVAVVGESDEDRETGDLVRELLKNMNDASNTEGDLISPLALMAVLQGKESTWSFLKEQPSHFRPGGYLYQQVERDLGLVHNKHVRLPSIPDKVFRFNAVADLLELCLEPLGHFAVGPDMEQRISEARAQEGQTPGGGSTTGGAPSSTSSFHTLSELTDEAKKVLGSGSTGVAVNQPMKWPGAGSHVAAFSGVGHSLTGSGSGGGVSTGSSSRVVGVESPRRHKPMETDAEEDEDAALFSSAEESNMETDSKPSTSGGGAVRGGENPREREPRVFERIGPGYSRLNPSASNEANQRSEIFQTIASAIQDAINEDILQDDEVDSTELEEFQASVQEGHASLQEEDLVPGLSCSSQGIEHHLPGEFPVASSTQVQPDTTTSTVTPPGGNREKRHSRDIQMEPPVSSSSGGGNEDRQRNDQGPSPVQPAGTSQTNPDGKSEAGARLRSQDEGTSQEPGTAVGASDVEMEPPSSPKRSVPSDPNTEMVPSDDH